MPSYSPENHPKGRKSMMTDHNTTGRFVYCTDTSLGTVGVINEALLYSDENCIELLPALPNICC